MKKFIKYFLFAFVLFSFCLVKTNADTYKVNVILKNINPTNSEKVYSFSMQGNSSKNVTYAQLKTQGFAETVTSGDDTYTLEGWYTEDGTAIGQSYKY